MDIPENSIIEILENSPSQGTLYVLLSTLKESGRQNLVIRECLKSLFRFPDDLTLRKILAEAYLEEGRFFEAESEFNKVTKGIKALSGVYKSLAEINVRLKQEKKAIESLKQYHAISPEDEDAAILLEELLATSAVSSIELSEERIDTDIPETAEPGDADILETMEPDNIDIMEAREEEELHEIITVSLAETYFDQGKLAEAREIYEKLAHKDPENESVKARLDEISALMEPKEEPEIMQVEDTIRQKKERVISVLDSWRSNIRELAGENVTT